MMQSKGIVTLVFLFFLTRCCLGQPVLIGVVDSVYHTIGTNFYGIQYHDNTFSDLNALNLLDQLELKQVRVWAEVEDFHPDPETWNWDDLDRKIAEINAAGYQAVPCLWGERWYIGTPENPWWNHAEAVAEWEEAAFQLAQRYKNDVSRIILFDEFNMLNTGAAYYISFKKSAQLFIKAAKKIKYAAPNIICGGPSGFGGWENGHWANYVLNEPNGVDYLGFISSNTFLSWDADESDEVIINKTIWYEEVPLKIRQKIAGRADPELILDAYNLSALWTKGGQLWTDPRNTNLLGGIYQGLALLHSAKGGFDITFHWETIGGFGILNWFPAFKTLPPYHSWKFMIESAGLVEGTQVIGTTSSAEPLADAPHHSGMNVNSYTVQPFAIRRPDGNISVVLINKFADETIPMEINLPAGMNHYTVFRYDESRMLNYGDPLEESDIDQALILDSPPLSITVIKFEHLDNVNLREDNILSIRKNTLLDIYPNPFSSTTQISFQISKMTTVEISIFELNGRKIKTLVKDTLPAGQHQRSFDGSMLANGVYYCKMITRNGTSIKKLVFIR